MELIETKTIGKYRIDILPEDDPKAPPGYNYWYVIIDEEYDVEIDNGCGYSDVGECKKEAKSIVDYCIKKDKKQN